MGRQTTIIDSGTPQICGPTADVAKIVSMWQAVDEGDGTYSVSCGAELAPLSFEMSGGTYTFSAEDMIVTRSPKGRCVLGIAPQDGQPDWAFGDVFMRKYYTV